MFHPCADRMPRSYQEKRFFFEKKNQKTFLPLGSACGTARAAALATPRKQDKRLFASFSSEKEELSSGG
jgi:hypothetical protein